MVDSSKWLGNYPLKVAIRVQFPYPSPEPHLCYVYWEVRFILCYVYSEIRKRNILFN